MTSVVLAMFLAIAASASDSMHATTEQVRQWAISIPKPTYPTSARLRYASGSGFFKLRVEIKTGRVKDINTLRSTGRADLDSAAIQTFRQWRFKPGVLPSIRQLYPQSKDPLVQQDCFLGVPISFVLTSAGARVQ
jgi:TonB family protein